MTTCRHCGASIHLEESPPPFSPTWIHDEGGITCDITWAHPTLPPMDNAIEAVKVAEP